MRGDLSIVRIYELALGNFRLHGNVNKEGVREGLEEYKSAATHLG